MTAPMVPTACAHHDQSVILFMFTLRKKIRLLLKISASQIRNSRNPQHFEMVAEKYYRLLLVFLGFITMLVPVAQGDQPNPKPKKNTPYCQNVQGVKNPPCSVKGGTLKCPGSGLVPKCSKGKLLKCPSSHNTPICY
ncbi:uncharacterized protein MELLADRAFT_113951 [Melampsora larici-populina 98AG31]|uniref:Uncharacterized protein n=1 Tax=Melampsora larici-populina (strain 98AG31 / pathotype 3-4-7) TaxID=747676 RepID=F4SBM5_MELLP|nr:uncharacterized protein MELLADRAFT_113951 [Melampsora larici-populina 98AG31]EGF97959.1 hypothetical protein MELLADRAFT_113951 [Melampsora larici-populina 98AG31]